MSLFKPLSEKEKKMSEHLHDVSVCFVVLVLLVASLFFKRLVFPCFIITGFVFIFSDNMQIFKYLFFLMPFAVIFKLDPSSTSLFTVLELLAIFLFFVRKPAFEAQLGIFLGILIAIALPKSVSSPFELIKLPSGLLLYYCFVRSCRNASLKDFFPYIVSGLLLSSLLGFFKERIPRLLSMYSDLNYNRINGVFVLRYSGLFQDPNYFSVSVVLCILGIGILLFFINKKEKIFYSVVGITLIVLGLMTYSKSFLLTLAVILILLALHSGTSRSICITIAIVLAGALIYVLDPGRLFTRIIFRFETGDLTTGRIAIWNEYFESIFSSTSSFLFGHGLGSRLVRAQHSIWIESLYTVGALGILAYFIALFRIIRISRKKINRKVINYAGFAVVAAMFSFINGLLSFELPFYLMLSTLILNCDFKTEERISNG